MSFWGHSCAVLFSCAEDGVLILESNYLCIPQYNLTIFPIPTDNIAPPVAACLGDLVTVALLGLFSSLHLLIINTPIPLIIVILLTCAAVGWTVITRKNEYVGHLLTQGWTPLFAAMLVSSGTGIVLDTFVSRYEGFALLAVVIAGSSLPSFDCIFEG